MLAGCPVLEESLQVVLFYENPDISGMLKERLHLAESGKDDEVAKKVKQQVAQNMSGLEFEENRFTREKNKGTYFSRRERTMMHWSSTTGEYHNKIGFKRASIRRRANQGSFGSSRGQSCPPGPVGQSVCHAVQDEQVRRLCGRHRRGPEAGLPQQPSL